MKDAIIHISELIAHNSSVSTPEHDAERRPRSSRSQRATALCRELADLKPIAAGRSEQCVSVFRLAIVGQLRNAIRAPDLPELLPEDPVRPVSDQRHDFFVYRKNVLSVLGLRRDYPPHRLPGDVTHHGTPFLEASHEALNPALSARCALRTESHHDYAARDRAFSPGMRNPVLHEDVALSECDFTAPVEQHANFPLEDDDQIDAIRVVHDPVVDIAEFGADDSGIGAPEHCAEWRPCSSWSQRATALCRELADLKPIAAGRGEERVSVSSLGVVRQLRNAIGAPDLPELLPMICIRPRCHDRENLIIDCENVLAVFRLRRDYAP